MPPIVKVKGKVLYRKIGENIYLARRRRGITQDQLAEHTGLDRTYISQIENGWRNPSGKSLLELSRALGIRLDKLVGQKFPNESAKQKRIAKRR